MTSANSLSEVRQALENRKAKSANLDRLMVAYNVQSKGKTLSAHFSPSEAVDLLETAANRGRSISEVITRAAELGLPAVRRQFPAILGDRGGPPRQFHRVHTIRPHLVKLTKKWKILKKGKTLSGHFRPEQAIDVLETAQTRKMSTGSILKAAVRVGLPNVKKEFPRVHNLASIKVNLK